MFKYLSILILLVSASASVASATAGNAYAVKGAPCSFEGAIKASDPVTGDGILQCDATKWVSVVTSAPPAGTLPTLYQCPIVGDTCYGRYRMWPGGCNGQVSSTMKTCAAGNCGSSTYSCAKIN